MPRDLHPPGLRRAFAWVAGCVLLAGFAPLAAAAVTIEIDGVTGEFAGVARDNLELSQHLTRELSPARLRRLVREGEAQISKGLEPWGYYEVKVSSEIKEADGNTRAIFHVELGERVIVRAAAVSVAGAGEQIEPVQKALQAFEPRVGEGLDHWLYEQRKTQINGALQANGFLDSTLDRHRVEVTRGTASANIDLAWTSGERYRMGDVSFTGSQLPVEFVQRYVPWKPDAYYSLEDVLRLQQRLADADYFSTVSVSPQIDKRADGHVPVDVQLGPAKRTIYSASAFINTDTGPGGKLGVQQRWINSMGHKAGIALEYATRLESYSVNYRIPKPGIDNRMYSIVAGYRDEDTESTTSRLARLNVSETLDNWHRYTRTLGLQFVSGKFEVGYQQQSTDMLYAEALLQRRYSDDQLFTRRGFSVTYTARAAGDDMLSDVTLLQFRTDLKWVRPAGDNGRLLLRVSAGAMTTSDFDSLPPELRFFAGGDRSVRGFDYQQIGDPVVDANGQLVPPPEGEDPSVIGGRYLGVVSGEYEYYFTSQWGGAVFVDAGDAFTTSRNLNVGIGAGVRWRSPVGLVRVDLAFPYKTDTDDRGVRFHIMIGPDL